MNAVEHILVCGATRSGKSEAELARLVPRAQANDCAIVLLDPPGGLAAKFLLHLDSLALRRRVLFDRLADTDRVPGYAWLMPSEHPDPLQRQAENDERVQEFASILLRRRNIRDPALTPLIEEGLLAALRLYLHQDALVPLAWLADVFSPGSEVRARMLDHCTESEVVRKFHVYASLSPTARRTETGPAERILRAVCQSPAFYVRSHGATFDLDRFLDDHGILILDGSSRGNLSRDAAAIMMGALTLRVIQHCRTGSRAKVVVALDEAVNANLIGVHESRALAEAAKWGLEFHVIVQDPFNFPSEEIRNNVLQNCGRHEWFRQGSPAAARLAAEDIGTPLLDPLQVHHTEYRVRASDAGFERIQTSGHSQSFDRHGRILRRDTTWQTVLWPRRREVTDAQDRYTTLNDQLLLIQKQLMLLKPGFRYVRSASVTTEPEYVRMLRPPWSAPDGLPESGVPAVLKRLADQKLQQILAAIKQRPTYRSLHEECGPRLPSPTEAGAAARLSTLAKQRRDYPSSGAQLHA